MNRNDLKIKDRKNKDFQKFKRCRDELRCLTIELRIGFENQLIKNIRQKLKSFWR